MGDEAGDLRGQLRELVQHTRAWVAWLRDSGLDEAHIRGDPAQLLKAPAEGGRRRHAPARSEPRQAPRRAVPQQAPPQQAPPQQAPSQGAAPQHAPPQQAPPQQAPAQQAHAASPASPAPAAPAATDSNDDPAERRRRLAVLEEEVSRCTKCRLHESRTKTAFSRGNPDGDIVFIGEGPGLQEDQQGIPFVGKAGQLLDKMIVAMGYGRDDVYVANIVKCRPPDNRKPEPDEVKACAPYLEEQLSLVRPKVMVALGATGVQGLIGTTMGITRMRGKWKLYKGRIPLMPTFHPAYLLRQPAKKREVWNDLKEVMKRLGKTPPSKKSSGGEEG